VGILDDESVRGQLLQAWKESEPGTASAHEEGGFVLRNADGSLDVERWPTGRQNEIYVPVHTRGLRGDRPIVATFHTSEHWARLSAGARSDRHSGRP